MQSLGQYSSTCGQSSTGEPTISLIGASTLQMMAMSA